LDVPEDRKITLVISGNHMQFPVVFSILFCFMKSILFTIHAN